MMQHHSSEEQNSQLHSCGIQNLQTYSPDVNIYENVVTILF